MNFWKNPANNPLKVLIIVIIVILAGYFAFSYMHKAPLASTGRVIDTSAQSAMPAATATTTAFGLGFSETSSGASCAITVSNPKNISESVTVVGTPNASGSCVPSTKQPTMGALALAQAGGGSVYPLPNPQYEELEYGDACYYNHDNGDGTITTYTGTWTEGTGGGPDFCDTTVDPCDHDADQDTPTSSGGLTNGGTKVTPNPTICKNDTGASIAASAVAQAFMNIFPDTAQRQATAAPSAQQ